MLWPCHHVHVGSRRRKLTLRAEHRDSASYGPHLRLTTHYTSLPKPSLFETPDVLLQYSRALACKLCGLWLISSEGHAANRLKV